MELHMEPDRELTFGQKAVGLSFNPSGDTTVTKIKEQAAALLDTLQELRTQASGEEAGEIKRLASVAITELQGAQMWGVKAATWGK